MIIQEETLKKFESMPMPDKKEEDWRYAEIEKLKLDNFDLFKANTKIDFDIAENLADKGVLVTDINTALEKYPIAQDYFFKNIKIDKDKFISLNASFFNNGIFLYVPKNVEIEEPIKINFHFEGQNSVLHNVIVAEPNSKVCFAEEYSNKAAGKEQLNSCITEVFAGENSKISFYHLNNWTKNVYNFTNIIASLERNAAVNFISGCFGGKLNRLRIDSFF